MPADKAAGDEGATRYCCSNNNLAIGRGTAWRRQMATHPDYSALDDFDLDPPPPCFRPTLQFFNCSLTKLRLDANNIEVIPPELGARTNLKYLSLDRNNLVDLPLTMKKMATLSTLTLSRNAFTCNHFEKFAVLSLSRAGGACYLCWVAVCA